MRGVILGLAIWIQACRTKVRATVRMLLQLHHKALGCMRGTAGVQTGAGSHERPPLQLSGRPKPATWWLISPGRHALTHRRAIVRPTQHARTHLSGS